MAKNGVKIVEKVILEEFKGKIDEQNKVWLIPKTINEDIINIFSIY